MSEKQPRSEPDVVISTVRRVVSGPTETEAPRAPAPERLLLTPSLRVDEADADVPPTPPGPRRRARVQTRTLAAERVSLEQRIAELELAVGDGGGWEPDGSEPIDTETPTEFVFGNPGRSRGPEPLPETQGTVTLVDENDLVRADRSVEPEGEPESPDLTVDPRPAPVAALRPVQMAEPVRAAPEPEPEPIDEEAETGLDFDEERVIDEEALRDLVAEIVRSELQGELGERITRNVRKLVRREIHRAIMTRDFG